MRSYGRWQKTNSLWGNAAAKCPVFLSRNWSQISHLVTGRCSLFIQPVKQQHTVKQRLQLHPQRREVVRSWLPFRSAEWTWSQWLSSGYLQRQRHWRNLLHCHAEQHGFLHWCLHGKRQNPLAGWATRRPDGRWHFTSNSRLSCHLSRHRDPREEPLILATWSR